MSETFYKKSFNIVHVGEKWVFPKEFFYRTIKIGLESFSFNCGFKKKHFLKYLSLDMIYFENMIFVSFACHLELLKWFSLLSGEKLQTPWVTFCVIPQLNKLLFQEKLQKWFLSFWWHRIMCQFLMFFWWSQLSLFKENVLQQLRWKSTHEFSF